MTTHKEIGLRIRNLRECKGLEQSDLANKLGYKSQSTISKWEKGINLPSGKNMIKLAQIFGVTSDYILDGDEDGNIQNETIELKDVLNRTVAFDGHTLDDNDAELIKSLLENMVKNKD